jgi:hypothetical protein
MTGSYTYWVIRRDRDKMYLRSSAAGTYVPTAENGFARERGNKDKAEELCEQLSRIEKHTVIRLTGTLDPDRNNMIVWSVENPREIRQTTLSFEDEPT